MKKDNVARIKKVGSEGDMLDGDLAIRRTFSAGPDNAPGGQSQSVIATIEVIGGFELFNTVPYHNYECWGQGYRVTAGGVSAVSEYLDDALRKWENAYCKAKGLDVLKIRGSMKIEGWPPLITESSE